MKKRTKKEFDPSKIKDLKERYGADDIMAFFSGIDIPDVRLLLTCLPCPYIFFQGTQKALSETGGSSSKKSAFPRTSRDTKDDLILAGITFFFLQLTGSSIFCFVVQPRGPGIHFFLLMLRDDP